MERSCAAPLFPLSPLQTAADADWSPTRLTTSRSPPLLACRCTQVLGLDAVVVMCADVSVSAGGCEF